MMRRFLFSVLLIASTAYAGIHTAYRDSLDQCTANCVAGAGVEQVRVESTAFIMQIRSTGTVNAQIENSSDNGTTWTAVQNGSCTACGATEKFGIANPVGLYRWNVTVCTSCTYNQSYEIGRLRP